MSLDKIARTSKCIEIVNLIIKPCTRFLMTALQSANLLTVNIFTGTAVRGQVVHHTESIVKIKFQLMEALCRIVRELVMYSVMLV